MSCLVYLVRHGETDWNKTGRIQGQQDLPLNELGRRQAEAVGTYLAELRFGYDYIYTSDLVRARETAEIIAKRWGSQTLARRELRELSFGEIEGLDFNEVQARYPEFWKAYQDNSVDTVFPGGESVAQLGERATEFFRFIREQHQDDSILVVAHGGFIKSFLAIVLGLPLANRGRIEVTNASVSVVRIQEEKAKILAMNVTHHLAQVF